MKRTLIIVPLAALAASVLVACGDGPDEETTSTATTTSAGTTRTATATTATGAAIVLENPTVTATGLKYVDEVVGTGATPTMSSTVTVHYTGKLASNGQVFDSSVQRGQPATFRMSGVIKGFSEGLSTMKEGGKRTVFIPAELGYGASGNRGIPPNADLIFEIESIKVQ